MKRLLLIVLTLINCTNDDNEFDIDLSEFEEGRTYDYKKFSPSNEIKYWDYIQECSTDLEGNYTIDILYSVGNKCDSQVCIEDYKRNYRTHPFYDFLGPCENCCTELIRYEKFEKVNLLKPQNYADFLGEINNLDEAIWLLSINNYSLTDPEIKGYMKEIANGYEFIAEIETNFCNPVRYEKHHIKMNYLGEITILNKEIILEIDGCPQN